MSSSVREQEHHRLADAMPHIVWTHDAEGTPTYFNRKWTEYTGLDLAESLRVGPASLVHPSDVDELVRRANETRAAGTSLEATYRLRRRDGAYRWHQAYVVPIRGDGAVDSWVGTAVDVHDQRRRQDEQKFLAEAGAVLGTSLDLGTTLRDVARLVVPHLADWCAIDLLTSTDVFERQAVAHVDPAKVALAAELWKRRPPDPADPHGLYAVVRGRRPELFEDIPDELLVASIDDPELLAIVRDLGLRSSMCVPLVVRDHALGALTLVSTDPGRRYGVRDLEFAEELARRIAVAVDNAQLYGAMQAARAAAEALAADVIEQSRQMHDALLKMRGERDDAVRRLAPAGGAQE